MRERQERRVTFRFPAQLSEWMVYESATSVMMLHNKQPHNLSGLHQQPFNFILMRP